LIFFLSLVAGPVYADDWRDIKDAFDRGDYKTVFEKLKPLAEQGDALAQFNLGSIYYQGKGVSQDYKEAAKWFRLSAEQGEKVAQFTLGKMYEEGKGVKQDKAEAIKWYQKAAEQGDTSAQISLGNCYEKGQGVNQNFVLAYKWFNIAAYNSLTLGRKETSSLKKLMSPDQITEAQKLTEEWLDKNKKNWRSGGTNTLNRLKREAVSAEEMNRKYNQFK